MTRFARYGYRKVGGATAWSDMKKAAAGGTNSELDQLEAKRAARRMRKKTAKPCFNCRETGHTVSECPNASKEDAKTGICYKCGAKNHTTKVCRKTTTAEEGEFPFATCFVCKKQGHLTRSCPDNPNGLYPSGGGCKLCGEKTHLRQDCPKDSRNNKAAAPEASMGTINLKQSADDDDNHAMLRAQDRERQWRKGADQHRAPGRPAPSSSAGSSSTKTKTKVVSF